MAVAVTGVLTSAMVHCRTLIANCPTFQSIVGAANVEAAKTRIHIYRARTDHVRPRAIIAIGAYGHEREGPGNWNETGALDVSFEFPTPNAEDDGNIDADIWFGNAWEAIYGEMRDRSGGFSATSEPMLNFNAGSVVLLPEAVDEDGGGEPYHGVMITINYPSVG